MNTPITREQALDLLLKYNKDSFHIEHALTVEGVMGWYAREIGYGAEEAFWRLAGLLHDIDFECYPDEHCQKAPELLAEIDAGEELTHAVCSHGYGLVCDVKPEHEMEKVLFAVDELTGLINAGALVRPSKSVMDMGADSVKRKFKDKHFARAPKTSAGSLKSFSKKPSSPCAIAKPASAKNCRSSLSEQKLYKTFC